MKNQLVRVLIVDDIAEVRRDLSLLLQLSGSVEITGEAADGAEAIRLAETMLPDVVLMDLEMPILDGYAATRQIKSRLPGCRVIAFSVHSYPAARFKALQAGVDDFIEKGAALQEILQVLQEK